MAQLITVERAKREIKKLQSYVELVEAYEADTIEKWVIKEYALTNSMVKVVDNAKKIGKKNNGAIIDKPFVLNVINSKSTDELHKLLQSGYKQKIKPSKRYS